MESFAKYWKGQTSTYSYIGLFDYLAWINFIPQKEYKSKFALRLKKPQIFSEILTQESQMSHLGQMF